MSTQVPSPFPCPRHCRGEVMGAQFQPHPPPGTLALCALEHFSVWGVTPSAHSAGS